MCNVKTPSAYGDVSLPMISAVY